VKQLCWQVDSAIMDQCDNDACVPICSRLKYGNLLSGVITQINVLATIMQASTWGFWITFNESSAFLILN
jgi:hypothetical protein